MQAPRGPVAAPGSTDVTTFLRRLHNTAIKVAAEEAHSGALVQGEGRLGAAVESDWRRTKSDLMSILGLGVSIGAPAAAPAPAIAATAAVPPAAPGAWAAPALAPAAPAVAAPAALAALANPATPRPAADPYVTELCGVVHGMAGMIATGSTAGGAGAGGAAAPAAAPAAGGVLCAPVVQQIGVLAEQYHAADDRAAGQSGAAGALARTRLWHLLCSIASEDSPSPLPYASYRSRWGNAPPQADFAATAGLRFTAPNAAAQEMWTYGALRFLSQYYASLLVDAAASQPGANHAGQYGIQGAVEATITGQLTRGRPAWYDEAVRRTGVVAGSGHPFYPQLFYLLRSGALAEARALAERHSKAGSAGVPAHVILALSAFLSVLDGIASDVSTDSVVGGASGSLAANAGYLRSGTGSMALDPALPSARAVTAAMRDGADVAIQATAQDYLSMREKSVRGELVDPYELEVLCLLSGVEGDSDWTAHEGLKVHRDLSLHTRFGWAWQKLWFAATYQLAIRTAPAVNSTFAAATGAARPVGCTLQSFAADVLKAGASGWAKDVSHSYAYTEALLLCGQPELAVAHLAVHGHAESRSRHFPDAMHLALALNWYGALRTYPVAMLRKAVDTDPTLVMPAELQPVADMGGLLWTWDAAAASASAAPVYILDLPKLLEIYCDRVVQNDGFRCADYARCVPQDVARVAMLGRLLSVSPQLFEYCKRHDATGRSGAAPAATLAEMTRIARYAAELATREGRFVAAVDLYQASSKEGLLPAARLLVNRLSELAHQPLEPRASVTPAAAQERDDVRQRADAAAGLMARHLGEISRLAGGGDASVVSRALQSTLQVAAFYDYAAAGNLQDALRALDASELIPVPPAAAVADFSEQWVSAVC